VLNSDFTDVRIPSF